MKKLLFVFLLLISFQFTSQTVKNDPLFDIGTGFDNLVRTIATQPDGKTIVGGQFTSYNGLQTNYLIRLNIDGSKDTTFDIGIGFNGWVWTTLIQPDGKIIVGGDFSFCNGVPKSRIVRLNQDGSIDNSFNSEFIGTTRSLCIQPDGKIFVGGNFTSINGTPAIRIARLYPDGTLDMSFNTGLGLEGGSGGTSVYAIALQSNGKILVGGSFTSFNGLTSNNIVRINSDGSIDNTFNIGSGFSSQVWSITIQTDDDILVGGYFDYYNGLLAPHVIRLKENGSIDNSFNVGSGANNVIYSLKLRSNGKILIAGSFDSFDGVQVKNIVQLKNNGQIDQSFNSGLGFSNSGLNSQIKTVSLQDSNRIITGGIFSSFDGLNRNNIARLIACDTIISISICSNDIYLLNGQTYSQPGQYTQTLTNEFGIDSVLLLNLTVNTNENVSISPNPAFGNAPLNVAFANQTQNLSNYNFTWYFGDGTSQQSNAPFLSHTYTQDGYADVTVVAENLTSGCTSTQTFNDMIFVIGGVTCTHTAALNQSTALSGCVGDSLLLSCNTDPSFAYQWNRNGIPVSGATSSSFYPTQSGSYTVTIYQNNCPVTSAGISVSINPLPAVPTIASSGTITPCSGGSMTLTAQSGFTNYLWNTGSTSSSLVVSQSGNYSVTVTNTNVCSRTSNPFVVNASFMQPQQVCIVGMDSLTNENKIIWEKPVTLGIDSFYVYKETNVSNVYAKIGGTDYTDLAILLDANSNPAVQAYRYKVSILDTCGVETNLGDFHKTIHLTINQGIGGAWNLIWSHYEGLNFGSYKIYRGTDPTNISLLTTIQSNLNSYTDLTPPTGPLYYQIEVVNPVNCDPTKIINYGVSRSNIVNNGLSGVQVIVNRNIVVYPNPTNSNITLEVSSELVGKMYLILDFSGRIILHGKISSNQEHIDLQHVARGAYYLSIDKSSSVTKLIKQ